LLPIIPHTIGPHHDGEDGHTGRGVIGDDGDDNLIGETTLLAKADPRDRKIRTGGGNEKEGQKEETKLMAATQQSW